MPCFSPHCKSFMSAPRYFLDLDSLQHLYSSIRNWHQLFFSGSNPFWRGIESKNVQLKTYEQPRLDHQIWFCVMELITWLMHRWLYFGTRWLIFSTRSTIYSTPDRSLKMVAHWKQTLRSMLTYNNVTAPMCVFHTLAASGEEKLPSTLTVLIKLYLSPGISSPRMLGSGEIRLGVKIHC